MNNLYVKIGKKTKDVKYKSIIKILTICFAVIILVMFPEINKGLNEKYIELKNKDFKSEVSIFTDIGLMLEGLPQNLRTGIAILAGFIGMLTIIFLIIKITFKKENITEVIIEHSSMKNFILKINKKNDFKVEKIDLIEYMKKVEENYEEIKFVINKQDKFVEELGIGLKDNLRYGYVGIAHIPLIFRIGNKIGDGVLVQLFHKNRTEEKFKELSNNDTFPKMNIIYKNLDKNSSELIVGVATTFDIKLEELKILNPDEKNIIIFRSEELGYDIVTSKKQIEHYIKFITDEIKQVAKEKNIMKMHMALATSVTMTFALGQAMGNPHDAETIVYHFQQSNPKKYLWGINMTKDYRECLVIPTADNKEIFS